jgi:hypothetical protein
MKKILRILALIIVVGALAIWVMKGSHTGWTRNEVDIEFTDEVTGLVGHRQEKKFIPGIDFLGAALVGAGILTGVSFLIRSKKTGT